MYKLTKFDTIQRLADNAFIPKDPANSDYQRFLEWQAEGNEPEPFEELPEPIPSVVTMRQARLALLGAGLLGSVADAIAALPSPQKEAATIEWEYSQEVHRNRAFVTTLAAALGLTDEQMDELFLAASKL